MPTWSELEANFRELAPALTFRRLDYQWGAAGTNYRIAGGGIDPPMRRFEVLAALAGQKLLELPPGHVAEVALMRRDPAEKWYEAIKAHSGMLEYGLVGFQTDNEGNDRGTIYTATIGPFADASALLALQYSAIPAAQPHLKLGRWGHLNKWLTQQREERGAFWALVAVIVTVILAILAIAV